MKLAAGIKIKDYTLDEMLGHGAAGEVWKAHDDSKTVAIKFMNPRLLEGADADKHRTRLQREVDALTRLQHPNVPTLYDHDLTFERPYLVMRYIGGDTYDKLITRGQMLQIRIDQRLHMITELARALEAAHALGIIHRDIKPANMIGIDNPYLLDFGIALTAESADMTMRNIGTTLYMDPDDPPDELSDNFSFALVAYEVLFGTHAIFTRDNMVNNQFAVYSRFLAGERIKNRQWRLPSKVQKNELPPDLRNADLPRLDAIFEKAMGERETRYTDLRDFVNDLKSAIPIDLKTNNNSETFQLVTAVQADRSTRVSEDQFTVLQASNPNIPATPRQGINPRLLIIGAAALIVVAIVVFLVLKPG